MSKCSSCASKASEASLDHIGLESNTFLKRCSVNVLIEYIYSVSQNIKAYCRNVRNMFHSSKQKQYNEGQ